MNKNKVAIIVAIIGAIATLGGGAASGVITIDMFNTDNSSTDIRGDTTITGDSNTVVNVDGEGLTCEQLRDACQDVNLEGVLKSACLGLKIICPGS